VSDVLSQFQALFVGGELGYGELHPETGAVTRKGATPPIAYEKHLGGHVGLGLVPVRVDGTCLWGAIDVDVDNIDHKQVASKIADLKLPLHVCRSRSGAAHLYVFMQTPLTAEVLRKTLKGWSGLVGYPKAEIFPKQNRIDKTNVGSWLNLPYFGSDRTTRYHVKPDGAISSLENFLGEIQYYDPKKFAGASKPKTAQMPPCLARITQDGVSVGRRNDTLFNVTIYHRKAFPSEWRERTDTFNSQLPSPLDPRELSAILNSNEKNRYHYTCDRSPLADFCDRATCEKLPFGVKHHFGAEGGSGSASYSNLRKITSDPPIFLLEINGKDVELRGEQLLDFKQVRLKSMMKLNVVIPMVKQVQWDQQVQELFGSLTEIEAPEDSGIEGAVMIRFEEFLALRKRARTQEDLVRQKIPIELDKDIVFRGIDLKQYIKSIMRIDIDESQLYRWIHKRGGRHLKLKVLGRDVTAWSIPASAANEINADYTGPQFETISEEEL
jgi:hypothetical protein